MVNGQLLASIENDIDWENLGAYTVLVWVYVYFHVQKRRRRRPHFYDISVLALYLLITIITILSTASFYQESISVTTLEVASNYFRPRPDSHYIFFLNME